MTSKKRDGCKLCGHALEEIRVTVRGREIIVLHCPSCCPRPIEMLRGQ